MVLKDYITIINKLIKLRNDDFRKIIKPYTDEIDLEQFSLIWI